MNIKDILLIFSSIESPLVSVALRQVFHFHEVMFQSLCVVAAPLKEKGHLLGFV